MRRTSLSIAALLAVAVVVVVSCTDRPPTAPPMRPLSKSANITPGTCTTLSNLVSLVATVFGAGSPNISSALGKLDNFAKKLAKGDIPGAQAAARNLISFLQRKANSLPGKAQVQLLIQAIECFAGLTDDTVLVYPSDQPQTIVTNSGQAGLQLPANPVTEPTLITVTVLDPNAPSPLITKLDKYPGYISVTQESGVPNSLTGPVTVAVCPAVGIPDSIRSRLRLGHQASPGAAGFEVTPPADGSFLTCSGTASAASRLPGWVKSLASLVLPKPLYARQFAAGGVGGSASEFSPFGPVDPVLSFAGGVGGSASEFLRAPEATDTAAASGTKKPADPKKRTSAAPRAAGSLVTPMSFVDCSSAVVGTTLPAECRPLVTLKTALGTVMQNVPVGWAIGLGGGQTAKDTLGIPDCLAFGATASTNTNLNGNARACWTMGPNAGTNTLIATPSAGGDAPAGVTFSPATYTSTVTATKNTATISLTDLTPTYDGNPKSATVTTTPLGLTTVNVTYNGSATVPTAAGTYTVVATLVNPSYEGTATGTLVIGQASQTALSVTGAATGTFGPTTIPLGTSGGSGTGAVSFGAGASTACSVTSAGVVTITSGTGTCSVTATKAGDTNFSPVTSEPFTITVSKATASIALSDLDHTYDGTAKSATATTTPASLAAVTITYDGSTTAPIDAGSYAVVASLNNPDYSAPDAPGTLNIAMANQGALTVTGSNTIAFGGSTVALSTTGGNGSGAVTFSATGSAACSVTPAGVVTATSGTGSCNITATKAADGNYNAVTSETFAIAVTKAAATITLGNLTPTFDGSPKSASATTDPLGLGAVSITYDGSGTAPSAAGSYAVVASLTNPDYVAAPASGTLVISKAGQTALSVTGPGGATYGDAPVQVGTSGGSGNGALTFSAGASTACAVTPGGSLTVITGSGSCSITVTKADDGNYSELTSAAFPISISRKSTTLALSDLSWTFNGSPRSATVTTTPSGLNVVTITYDGSSTAPSNAGSYAVVASLSNADYTAPNATGTLVIGAANQPTLIVTGPPSATYGAGTVQLGTTGGAGSGSVTYAGTTPTACSVNTGTGQVTILSGTGSCIVSAAKAGDGNYNAATSANLSIALNKANQSISFSALSGKTYGDPAFSVSATASSGLPASFAAGVGDKCTVSGSTVTLTGAGNCTVTASQAGNANFYNAAAPVPQSFTIAKHAATATAGSGSRLFAASNPTLACARSGLLATEPSAFTCTTSIPATPTAGTYVTTPVINPLDPANYNVTKVNGTLTVIGYVQQGCFASPINNSVTPPVMTGVSKGTSVTVKCRLLEPSGRPIVTAKGNLLVQDKGTNGLATPPATPAYSGTNVFTVSDDRDFDSDDGFYSYKLSTSGAAFLRGHYFLVTATWNDGSTTKGWIYIKP